MTDAQPAKVLASFHYHPRADFDALAGLAGPAGLMLMGDCGAYTAHVSGRPIDLAEYLAWTQRWDHRLFSYPTLDVIGDAAGTEVNHRLMLAAGRTPIAVVHYPDRMAILKGYLDRGDRYIALGNLVTEGGGGGDRLRWATACFKTGEPYGAAFHGFGFTNLTGLRALPWYSADSSSVGAGVRFGQVQLFDGRRLIVLRRQEPRALYEHADLIRASGGAPADMDNRYTLRGPGSGATDGHRRFAYRIGVVTWRRVEEHLRALHGPVAGPRQGDPPGPHIFQTDSTYGHLRHLVTEAADFPGPYFAKGVAP